VHIAGTGGGEGGEHILQGKKKMAWVQFLDISTVMVVGPGEGSGMADGCEIKTEANSFEIQHWI